MRFSLFDYLRYSIPKNHENTPEKYLFDKESGLLGRFEPTRKYAEINSPFDLIKAQVIIEGLLNKKQIEDLSLLYPNQEILDSKQFNAVHKDQPYFEFNNQRIFVPFFPLRVNYRYDVAISSLNKEPMAVLKTAKGMETFFFDPFNEYGPKAFDSPFTRLLKIEEAENLTIFYSYSFETIFMVSDEGTLECSIPIFDKDLIHPDRHNLPTRIKQLLEPYFDYNREEFITRLLSLGFISHNLYDLIQAKSRKAQSSKGKLEESEK